VTQGSLSQYCGLSFGRSGRRPATQVGARFIKPSPELDIASAAHVGEAVLDDWPSQPVLLGRHASR
jgi:hypothetical protein